MFKENLIYACSNAANNGSMLKFVMLFEFSVWLGFSLCLGLLRERSNWLFVVAGICVFAEGSAGFKHWKGSYV